MYIYISEYLIPRKRGEKPCRVHVTAVSTEYKSEQDLKSTHLQGVGFL